MDAVTPIPTVEQRLAAADKTTRENFKTLQAHYENSAFDLLMFAIARQGYKIVDYIRHLCARSPALAALHKEKSYALPLIFSNILRDGRQINARPGTPGALVAEAVADDLGIPLDQLRTPPQKNAVPRPMRMKNMRPGLVPDLAPLDRGHNGGDDAAPVEAAKPVEEAPVPPQETKAPDTKPAPDGANEEEKPAARTVDTARFSVLAEKLSPQRPALLSAMAKFATAEEMAAAICKAANKKPDDINMRTVIHGLAAYAKTGRAPLVVVAEAKPAWYAGKIAEMEGMTVSALLAATGPAQPAPPGGGQPASQAAAPAARDPR